MNYVRRHVKRHTLNHHVEHVRNNEYILDTVNKIPLIYFEES